VPPNAPFETAANSHANELIPPFADGENVTLMSTKVPHASMLQTSVHGCDAPVADVTRVLRICVPPHFNQTIYLRVG
jgi:hypothetical protein